MAVYELGGKPNTVARTCSTAYNSSHLEFYYIVVSLFGAINSEDKSFLKKKTMHRT